MNWNFTNDRPIYTQIVEQMERAIVSGIFEVGSALPSVRELAVQAGVNPNTMQRALADLEQTGLVYTNRTAGRFVTGDKEMIQDIKMKLASMRIHDFLNEMKELGISQKECIWLLENESKEAKEKEEVGK